VRNFIAVLVLDGVLKVNLVRLRARNPARGNCLVPMDSQSDFQILQCIMIPVIYRLFVFIFRYLIFFNIIRKLLLFLKDNCTNKLDIVLICSNKS